MQLKETHRSMELVIKWFLIQAKKRATKNLSHAAGAMGAAGSETAAGCLRCRAEAPARTGFDKVESLEKEDRREVR